MTKIINLGTSAFYELQEATKKAKISFGGFETAISKAFPKQAKKEKSTKDEIQKIYFKAIGDKFYNLSRKIKNELKK